MKVFAIGHAMESYSNYTCARPVQNLITGTDTSQCLEHPDIYKYPVYDKQVNDGGDYYLSIPGYERSLCDLFFTDSTTDFWIHTKMVITNNALEYRPALGTTASYDLFRVVSINGDDVIRLEQTVNSNDAYSGGNHVELRLHVGNISEALTLPINQIFELDMHFSNGNFSMYVDQVFVPLVNGNTYTLVTEVFKIAFGDSVRRMYNTTLFKHFVVSDSLLLGYDVNTVYPTRSSDAVADWAPASGAREFTDRRPASNLIPESSYFAGFDKAAQTFEFAPTNTRTTIEATQLNGVFYDGTPNAGLYFIESIHDNITDLSGPKRVAQTPTHLKQITDTPIPIYDQLKRYGFLLEEKI